MFWLCNNFCFVTFLFCNKHSFIANTQTFFVPSQRHSLNVASVSLSVKEVELGKIVSFNGRIFSKSIVIRLHRNLSTIHIHPVKFSLDANLGTMKNNVEIIHPNKTNTTTSMTKMSFQMFNSMELVINEIYFLIETSRKVFLIRPLLVE